MTHRLRTIGVVAGCLDEAQGKYTSRTLAVPCRSLLSSLVPWWIWAVFWRLLCWRCCWRQAETGCVHKLQCASLSSFRPRNFPWWPNASWVLTRDANPTWELSHFLPDTVCKSGLLWNSKLQGHTALTLSVRELFLGQVGVLSLSVLLGDTAQFHVVSVHSPLFILPCSLHVWLDLHPHDKLCWSCSSQYFGLCFYLKIELQAHSPSMWELEARSSGGQDNL